jgi:hypothetical protein
MNPPATAGQAVERVLALRRPLLSPRERRDAVARQGGGRVARNEPTGIIIRWLAHDPATAERLRTIMREQSAVGALRSEAEDLITDDAGKPPATDLIAWAERNDALSGSRENTLRVLLGSLDWDAVADALDAGHAG